MSGWFFRNASRAKHFFVPVDTLDAYALAWAFLQLLRVTCTADRTIVEVSWFVLWACSIGERDALCSAYLLKSVSLNASTTSVAGCMLMKINGFQLWRCVYHIYIFTIQSQVSSFFADRSDVRVCARFFSQHLHDEFLPLVGSQRFIPGLPRVLTTFLYFVTLQKKWLNGWWDWSSLQPPQCPWDPFLHFEWSWSYIGSTCSW